MNGKLRANDDGCWIYSGHPSHRYADTRRGRLSRLVLEGELGRKLDRKEFAMHTCDVPKCLNPAHIVLGDATANNRDTVAKGRYRNGNNKMPPTRRREAVALVRGGRTQTEVAKQFGVSQVLVGVYVRSGKYG